MARKIREDEYIDSKGRIRRGKKPKDPLAPYNEATDRVNEIMDNIGGV